VEDAQDVALMLDSEESIRQCAGDINYISIPSGNTDYWRIAVHGMTVRTNRSHWWVLCSDSLSVPMYQKCIPNSR
jgi:hypothetical protein